MNLVISAAETDLRSGPICLHPWENHTVLGELLGEVLAGGAFSRVVLVSPARDRQYEPVLREILRRAQVLVADAVFVPDARSVAESALVAARHLATVYGAATEPLFVHTLDAIQYGRDFPGIRAALDTWNGYVDVFPGEHRAAGDARIDRFRGVVEITPLRLLSGLSVTGLYGFRTVAEFTERAVGSVTLTDVCRHVLAEGGRLTSNADFTSTRTLLLPPIPQAAAA